MAERSAGLFIITCKHASNAESRELISRSECAAGVVAASRTRYAENVCCSGRMLRTRAYLRAERQHRDAILSIAVLATLAGR
jgi:hypothetical protein